MKEKRLLKLAKFLRTVKPRRFNLKEWVDQDFAANKCGTQACAIGWATTIFKRQGLKLTDMKEGMVINPFYNENKGFKAISYFFSISPGDVLYLFSDISYNERKSGPKSVARKIEKFVEKGR